MNPQAWMQKSYIYIDYIDYIREIINNFFLNYFS